MSSEMAGNVSVPSTSHFAPSYLTTVSSKSTFSLSGTTGHTAITSGHFRSSVSVSDELPLPGVPPEGSTDALHASGSLNGLVRSVSSTDHPPPDLSPSLKNSGVYDTACISD